MKLAPSLFALLCFAPLLAAPQRPEEGRVEPERTYDLIHVRWTMRFDIPRQIVYGDVTNTLALTKPDAKEIRLDCGRHLELDKISVNGRDANARRHGRNLFITLPIPSAKTKERLNVRVVYHGRPEAGLFFVERDAQYPNRHEEIWTQGEMEDNHNWLPTWDYPNDAATSEGTITVPKSWFALSNGKLIKTEVRNGTKTYHWKMTQPHATYLISFAAGKYSALRENWAGIPVISYVPPGRENEGRNSFAGTADIVRFFSRKTGLRYPYEKFAQIVVTDFMFGGMENITAVTNTVGTLFPDSERGLRESTGLVAHELAHQWFGDTVTCRNWGHIWINEGWAVFLQTHYWRERFGEDDFQLQKLGNFDGAISAHKSEKRPVVWHGFDPKDPQDMFDGHAYPGGAARMHVLEDTLGSARFWKGVAHFLNKHKHQMVDTDDFFAAMEEATGERLQRFKEEWFLRADYPRLKVTREGTKLKIEQLSEQLFQFDLDVWVMPAAQGQDWRRFKVSLSERIAELDIEDARPLAISIDPEVKLMMELEFERTRDMLTAEFVHNENAAARLRVLREMNRLKMDEDLLRYATAGLSLQVGGVKLAVGSILGHPLQLEAIRLLDEGRLGPALALQTYEFVRASSSIEKPRRKLPILKALLEKIDDVTTLLGVFRDTKAAPSMRETALNSLAHVKPPNLDAILEDAWQAETWRSNLKRRALEVWRDRDKEKSLRLAFEIAPYGGDDDLRPTAVSILGKHAKGDPRTLPLLVVLLHDKTFGIRRAAISALGELGDPSAVPHLEKLADHPSEILRDGSREAIKKLKK